MYENLFICDLKHTDGIRGSKNNDTLLKKYKWNLTKYHQYKNHFDKTSIIYESEKLLNHKNNLNQSDTQTFILGIITFNRLSYLQSLLISFNKYKNNSVRWIIIIADDGTDDIKQLKESLKDFEYITLLQTNYSGVARNTNSIFAYLVNKNITYDLLFLVNNDIYFKDYGWDNAYYDAISNGTTKYLVHYNTEWSRNICNFTEINQHIMKSIDIRRSQGAFIVTTKDIVDKVGMFNNIKFPLNGTEHIDYTYRSMKVIDQTVTLDSTTYDLCNSHKYIEYKSRKEYIPTITNYNLIKYYYNAKNRIDRIDLDCSDIFYWQDIEFI